MLCRMAAVAFFAHLLRYGDGRAVLYVDARTVPAAAGTVRTTIVLHGTTDDDDDGDLGSKSQRGAAKREPINVVGLYFGWTAPY